MKHATYILELNLVNLLKSNFVRFLNVLLLTLTASLVVGCASTTGQLLDQSALEFDSYTQNNKVYVYRKRQIYGVASGTSIEVNNKIIGNLGGGQVLEAELVQGANLIVSSYNLNERNYTLLLNVNSNKPYYLIASFDLPSLLKEVTFDQWKSMVLTNAK